ncbi:MAG TPA: SRPBCC family protein, partial [Chthoniobacteraceae bacterium]
KKTDKRIAQGLGWFSIAVGLATLLIPNALCRMIGDRRSTTTLRLLGVRDLAAGAGILSRPDEAGWLWARVAGGVMDLGLLGAAHRSRRADEDRVEGTAAAVAGVLALDLYTAVRLSGFGGGEARTIQVSRDITIERSPEELYRFWRDFENLPSFMTHLRSVEVHANGRSRWVAKAPAGTTVEWEAEIIRDKPNEMIAWCSLSGADVDNCGSVHFEPAAMGRGCLLRVKIDYTPPGGKLGATIAKLFGEEPQQQLDDDLERFKQLMESSAIRV